MKKKILIVDDNEDLNQIVQMTLNDSFETILAINGEDAVEMAATQQPDLILMDMIMPMMNGFEATRQISQNPKTRSIPILAVTVLETHEERELCLQSGCDDYIPKPFTFSLLFSHIEKLLKSSEKRHTA